MSKKIKVLLVEDDPNLGLLLSEYINAKGYECTLRVNGQEGYDTFIKDDFDFLIFDVMMPIKDGFTLAKEIRGIDKEIPILFLTAKSLKEDTLKGFNVGADDYMTKPFSMEELLARMNAILRRIPTQDENESGHYEIGFFDFDYNQQILSHGEESNKLTTKENELLKLLCKNKNGVLERNDALKAVWGDDNYFNGRSMDVYIAKLRKHLKADPSIEIINIHGKGFKLLAK
ncbi:MAG: response regulator transcription factor [Flavobacteriales bacterium]|jgi:DNA-binding response OmpR family regulator|nr:response regulator transcription factor [Flavobacteriales bacterium]